MPIYYPKRLWPRLGPLIGGQETAKLIFRGSGEVKLKREVCRKWPASDYCTHCCQDHHHLTATPRLLPSPLHSPFVCFGVEQHVWTIFHAHHHFTGVVWVCVCWMRWAMRLIIRGLLTAEVCSVVIGQQSDLFRCKELK